ncbi:hypothetical protein BZB76_6214 [Actinomadura pelletieri DSM 43383]|uniref:Uncharacterized protein n=1 Tax=Actinomadura pelletieri DSM 43383 TaxID=1120940 RepID=A0A495QBL2_9ACTN|nr:hypothetical protein [Actinomadura pelletieri]RKS69075.1 hypothetical protein BZB76_6214 [Actinomadura pelletieri DSM 43383]
MDYSAVEIREKNILALRAFLLEGPVTWASLQSEMQKDDETAAGYMSLLYGAFNVAVRRKFAPIYTVGDIVRFVAELRINSGEEAGLINPLVAEDMIRRAIGAPPLKDGGPDDVSVALHVEVYVLLHLITEADLGRAGLEQFIDEAVAYTEEWLAARRAEASAAPSSGTV